eukprot:snap_masked-scaffold_4-processed-gene-21.55-mRNA-1 protein AED:1.00 eAED:1.00 QI:0/0/0/0/1/1/2/0/87
MLKVHDRYSNENSTFIKKEGVWVQGLIFQRKQAKVFFFKNKRFPINILKKFKNLYFKEGKTFGFKKSYFQRKEDFGFKDYINKNRKS